LRREKVAAPCKKVEYATLKRFIPSYRSKGLGLSLPLPAEVFPISNKASWPVSLLAAALLLASGCSAAKNAAGPAGTGQPAGTIAAGGALPSAAPAVPSPAASVAPGNSPAPDSAAAAATAAASASPTPAASAAATPASGKPSAAAKPAATVKPAGKPAASTHPAATAKPDEAVTAIARPAEVAVWVNKSRQLPADYVPADLAEPQVRFPFSEKLEKRKMRKAAAAALERLFAAADKEGLKLYAVSGYRSYKTQAALFDAYVKRDGEAAAARYSARPGMSEHQTGLAMDVSCAAADFKLEESFGETTEGKWLAKHAPDYGFIIRYPKGTEKITGYQYEPWHIRYLGKELAQEVASQGITLDEYFSQAIPVTAP